MRLSVGSHGNQSIVILLHGDDGKFLSLLSLLRGYTARAVPARNGILESVLALALWKTRGGRRKEPEATRRIRWVGGEGVLARAGG